MATTYQANDRAAVPRWHIELFTDGSNQGEIFKITEDPGNTDLITIQAASGKSMTITKEHAVVLAEDLLIHYAALVGNITRESRR